MVATLAEFLAVLHAEVILPVSGLVVAIRCPDQMALLRLGEVLIPVAPAPPAPAPPTPAPPAPLPSSPEGGQDAAAPATPAPPPPDPVPQMPPQDFLRLKQGIVAAGVISPPMSDVRNDQGEPVYSTKAYLHVSELPTDDFECLFQAISQKMGLTAGDAAAAESFRADAQRPAGQAVGAGISEITP